MSYYTVVVGDTVRSVDEGTETTHTVADIIIHDNFDSSSFRNDIALIKLNQVTLMYKYYKL